MIIIETVLLILLLILIHFFILGYLLLRLCSEINAEQTSIIAVKPQPLNAEQTQRKPFYSVVNDGIEGGAMQHGFR